MIKPAGEDYRYLGAPGPLPKPLTEDEVDHLRGGGGTLTKRLIATIDEIERALAKREDELRAAIREIARLQIEAEHE